MAVWVWIAIAVAVVVLVLAAVVASAMVNFRRKTTRLKQHYGPEYERVVSETGSEKAAVQKLTAREQRHDKLDIVPLTPSALADFSARWQEVQARFVDDPGGAVDAADHLVTEVMRQRGYPVDDFDRRAADISVDHPEVVENYRAAHGVHASPDEAETEQQRKAFVHYRALFDKLLETRADGDAPSRHAKQARDHA